MKNHFILDINALPKEYKTDDGEFSLENLRKYEEDFNVKIVPLDSSPQNSKGQNPNNQYQFLGRY